MDIMNGKTANLHKDNANNWRDSEPEYGFLGWINREKNDAEWNGVQTGGIEVPHVRYVARTRRAGPGRKDSADCIQIPGIGRMDSMRHRSVGFIDPAPPRDLRHAARGVNSARNPPVFHNSGGGDQRHPWQRRIVSHHIWGRRKLLPVPVQLRGFRHGRRDLPGSLRGRMKGKCCVLCAVCCALCVVRCVRCVYLTFFF